MEDVKLLIEIQRENLEQLIVKKAGNLTDSDVVHASQRLDLLISKYARFMFD